MFVSEISLWGADLVAILVIIAAIVLAFFDGKMLRRILVIFGATVAQMAAVVAVMCQISKMKNREKVVWDFMPENYKN